jgi:D-xylose transport system permease protein
LPSFIAALLALAVLTWISMSYEGLSISIVWVILIGVGATFLMTRTSFGRNAYLIGSNREAAMYAGVNVGRNVFLGFALMGLFYGIGGVLLTARLGASTPGAGEFYELDAIAAAVIGGAALRGGRGTIVGAIAGALLLTTINNGMSILNISSFLQLVVKAVILVGALAIDSVATRSRST